MKKQNGWGHIVLIVAVLILAVIGFAAYKVFQPKNLLPSKDATGQAVNYDKAESQALANGNCQGVGAVTITAPMPIDQIGYVIPYGEVVGGHVTPIDHQYYWGLDTRSLRDTYDVLAPADGFIVSIGHRGNKTNTPPHTVDVPSSDEYRLVYSHTCSFLSYEDLITSLTPDIVAKLPGGHTLSNSQTVGVRIPVKKGQVIGHIGGQTLDFAVWDLSKPLKGFVNKADYAAESWKPYTAPPSQYMDASTKSQLLTKYIRTAAPVDGKIDYDIDGKLIGNWFQAGTGGYHAQSNTRPDYWNGHLSIAPDNIDPSVFIASIGNYGSYPGAVTKNNDPTQANNNSAQFMLLNPAQSPETVSVNSGAVKYELGLKQYVQPNGSRWTGLSFVTGLSASANNGIQATALAQLTAARTLKFEVFPGKTAAQVTGFDSHVTTYTR